MEPVRGLHERGGGDIHLLSSCASGRITRILMADVCGFGSMLSDIAGDLRELVKRNVNTIRQSGVVQQMSRQLAYASDRGCFASTLIGTFFAPTRSLTLCNAGHPPPLLYRATSGTWSALKREQPSMASFDRDESLGVVDPLEYQEFKTKLGLGDMVLSYSNVLTESRGPSGGTIGLEGLLDRVRLLDPDQPAQLTARLSASVLGEHAQNLAGHDATLLLCRATDRPVTWRDNILAPFRLFRPVQDHTRIG